jgi:hypothetical protein
MVYVLFTMLLGICRRLQGFEEEGVRMWAEGESRSKGVVPPAEYATVLLVHAGAEIKMGKIERAREICAEVDEILAGIPNKAIFECLWYRERIAAMFENKSIS